ncbi:hypothetical protein JXD20_01320 [Candidatus Peregrinibacteria bacterium]|nr:hypothetical protein [Candidatus Peregrinibacteria bacterium]
MSKSGTDADDRRTQEAGDAQIDDLNQQTAAPAEGGDELSKMRHRKFEVLKGGKSAPEEEGEPKPEPEPEEEGEPAPEEPEETEELSLEEIHQIFEAIPKGSHKKLRREANKYNEGPHRLIVIYSIEDGWRARAVDKDTEFVTVEESAELAELINSKINEEGMAKTAEKNRAKKAKMKARKEGEAGEENPDEAGEEAESPDLVLARKILASVPDITDKQALINLGSRCIEAGYFTRKREGKGKNRRTKYAAIEGKELSQELVDAFEAQFDALNAPERAKARIEGLIKKIETINDSDKLFGFARWIASNEELGLIKFKRGKGRDNWEVIAVEGIPESEALVKAIMKKKAELKTAEKAARAETARQEIEQALAKAIK